MKLTKSVLERGIRVKKLILGIAVMAIGAISTISIIVATVLSPLNPYSYNGVDGWYGCLLGMDLVMPFTVSIIVAIIGLAIAVWGVFDKNNKTYYLPSDWTVQRTGKSNGLLVLFLYRTSSCCFGFFSAHSCG